MFTFLYFIKEGFNRNNTAVVKECFSDSKQWINDTISCKQWLYIYFIYPKFDFIFRHGLELRLLETLYSIDEDTFGKLWENDIYQHITRNRVFGDYMETGSFDLSLALKNLYLTKKVCVYFILVLKLHFRMHILFLASFFFCLILRNRENGK